jgi:hypothetical protein
MFVYLASSVQGDTISLKQMKHMSDLQKKRKTLWSKSLLSKLETLKKRVVELESQVKSSTQTTTVSLTSVPETFLKTLIMLCHPDKHGNSEKALEATKTLLALRKPR